jgi:hypothetical protein
MTYKAITDQIKETVMDSSTTQSGAQLLTCAQDAACPAVDCDALIAEYTQALQGVPDAAEVVAHYCGLGYADKLTPAKPAG